MTETILKNIKKALNTEGQYDYTFTGQIVYKESSTRGTILYDGIRYSVTSTIPFEVGYIVRACAPHNNQNDIFITEVLIKSTESYDPEDDPSLPYYDARYIHASSKGVAEGVAELDTNGKVPSSQLPSYVDDVLEYESVSNFPTPGESGKIYVAKDVNKSYRQSGSGYVDMNEGVVLGETASTAYRGDRGKAAYDHASDPDKLTTATSSGFYKIAATANGHIQSLTSVTKEDITNLGIADSDYFTHIITSVTSSSTYSSYSYKCTIPYTGINETTNVDISINPNNYSGSYAVESGTDTLTVYFSTQPTLPLTVSIWLQK